MSREDSGAEAVSSQLRTDSAVDEAERAFESSLRPASLDEFVGQRRVVAQLDLVLKAATVANRVADHVLLAGPPGLGKTTLAMIVAAETGAALRVSSGPAIGHSGDLAALLSSLVPGEVLFIDEIHRMAKSAEEMLYLAMEDFRIDIMVGKGVGATSISLDLPPFTLVGATTRTGLLASPLRDRFGFTAHLEFYDADDLASVLTRSSRLLELDLPTDAITEISLRSRGTPRIANRLLRRVRDYLAVHPGDDALAATRSALELFEVDARGLDRLDRSVLAALIDKFDGGPVGVSSLAVSVGEESETIEFAVEPFLIREGLMARTQRGRIATRSAWQHLGRTAPATQTLFD